MTVPVTAVHHITLIGSTRDETIDFYQDVLGMRLIMEQPNLDVPEETHLYFDAGDGRLITFFVRAARSTDPEPVPETTGAVHHIAFGVSRDTFDQAATRLRELGYPNSGRIDRGFMDSLYFRDPNGLRLELSVYTFTPPQGHTVVAVLAAAHQLRVAAGDYAITRDHVEAALARLPSGASQ